KLPLGDRSHQRGGLRGRAADRHGRSGRSVADVEHTLNPSDAAERVLREWPAIGERADELPIDVDGAAAHAGDDARVLQPRTRDARENQILARSVPPEEPKDFNIEPLDPVAVAEVRDAVALHARRDLFDWENLPRLDLRRRGSLRR